MLGAKSNWVCEMTDRAWFQQLREALQAFRAREQADPERYPVETIEDLRLLGIDALRAASRVQIAAQDVSRFMELAA